LPGLPVDCHGIVRQGVQFSFVQGTPPIEQVYFLLAHIRFTCQGSDFSN
jgi:hypothetical protein